MAAPRRSQRRLLTGRSLSPVNLCSCLKQTKTGSKEKEVPPECASEEGVEKGVGAGVDGVEEHQQDFGIRHGDERELQSGGDGEEGDGSHADEVGEDEDGHALGDSCVSMGRRRRGVSDGQVDAEVTDADADEGKDVEEEDRQDVDLRGH